MSTDGYLLLALIIYVTIYNIVKIIIKSKRYPKSKIMDDLDELYDELGWQTSEQKIKYIKEQIEVKKQILNIK
jgi:hypothetical protein